VTDVILSLNRLVVQFPSVRDYPPPLPLPHFQWRRQRSKGAGSFRGQNILETGNPDAPFFLKKVDDLERPGVAPPLLILQKYVT